MQHFIINTATNHKCARLRQVNKGWVAMDLATGVTVYGDTALATFREWVRQFVGPFVDNLDCYPYHWYGVTVPQPTHYQREVLL